MLKILTALLSMVFLHGSVKAADKIRVGFPDLAAQFIPLPLAEKKISSKNKDCRESSSA